MFTLKSIYLFTNILGSNSRIYFFVWNYKTIDYDFLTTSEGEEMEMSAKAMEKEKYQQ